MPMLIPNSNSDLQEVRQNVVNIVNQIFYKYKTSDILGIFEFYVFNVGGCIPRKKYRIFTILQ